MDTEPLWRSLLYVPVTARRFVEKAHTRGADAIQLDLEDSIPPAQKEHARTLLPESIALLAHEGVDVVVRVNNTDALIWDDLNACVWPGVKAIAIPKVASASSVRHYDAVIREQEQSRGLPEGTIRFIVMIETPGGFCDMDDIARACPRIHAITLGSEDFATSLGISPDRDLLVGPKMRCVIAARAAGIVPLGLAGSIAGYQDEAAFSALAKESRRMGFAGASAIHPSQVPILNAAFSPTEAEIEQASKIVSAYAASTAQGIGAIEVDGKMVDEPIVERARATLRLHERLARRR